MAPIAVTAVLSSLHLWPFASRLVLFLCPLIVILFGAGVRVITASSPGHIPLMAVALATFCGPVVGLRETLQSPERSGVRAALQHFEPQILAGDVVYVYYKSAMAFRLYGPRILQGRPLAVTVGDRIDGSSATARRDVQQLVGHPRVWLLFSEVNTYWTDERSLVTGMLDQFGQRKRSYEADGAFLYLYDLGGDISQAPPSS